MTNLSLKLPEALDARLTMLARKRKQTKSAIVREAIEAFVRAPQGKKGISCRDLAGDLIGCAEGPGDLSHNPKYMEGFGR